MNHTKIEWVKNPDGSQGYTWNPITGCLNHTSDGLCLGGGFPCYAYKLAHGRLRERYLANDNISKIRVIYEGELNKAELDRALVDPFYPRFWPERLSKLLSNQSTLHQAFLSPYRYRTQKGIFVCDMGELFGDWIPRSWQERVFEAIRLHPEHRFYLLTKQPQNLAKWSPFPPNCWPGVTVTNSDQLIKAVNAFSVFFGEGDASHWFDMRKYISFEPLFSDMHDAEVLYGSLARVFQECKIFWVIIGAQTKPYKPPKLEWVEEIVKAADQAGVPVFLKDNLKPLFESANSLLDHLEWAVREWVQCKYPVLRQEMPK